MGRVEDAFDRALGRQVAIKHILSASPIDLARFEREARITARLEHPAIVPVHDAGRSPDGTPYYVMRHVDGRPLDDLVAGGELTARLALVPNVLAVCDAVGYAHARRVVHRDIKPSNILVGPFGETLLIDWGLARELGDAAEPEATGAPLGEGDSGDPQLTFAGAVAGTPGFMAPEQARGEIVDARADVFALGATLFHVLAGRPPYTAPSATEMIHAVSVDRPPDWTRIPRAVPADLLAIVHKAMASDAAARYPDAGAMAADLRRFVTGQLVAAHAYGVGEQLRRFARRHRGALAVGGVALVVLAVVGVLSFRRIVDERDHADQAFQSAEAQRRDLVDLRDGLLVDHAAELAETDPIAAIALLRDLAPASHRWPQAYAAATTAFFHGVPSGFELDPEGIAGLVAAPDNVHAFAATASGDYVILDLVARTQRVLATRPGGACVFVEGGTHLLCARFNRAHELIDVATGASDRLAIPDGAVRVATDGDAQAWYRVDDELFAVALDRRPVALGAPILQGVRDVFYAAGAHRLIAMTAHTIEIRGDGRRWTLPHAGHGMIDIEDGTRVVLGIDDHYEVWDLAGEPTSVWRLHLPPDALPLALIGDLAYGTNARELTGETRAGQTWTTPIGSTFGLAPGTLLASERDGGLMLRDADGMFTLGKRPLSYARLAITPDHHFALVGTATGLVVWFDLRALRPKVIHAEDSEHPAGLGRWLWTTDSMRAVARYDLDTGAVERRDVGVFMAAAFDPAERFVVLGAGDTVRVVDFDRNETVFTGTHADNWSFGALGLLVLGGRQLSRVIPPDPTVRPLATLPGPGLAVFQREQYALALTDAQACRIDASTGAIVCAPLPPTHETGSVAIDTDGRAWLTGAGNLYRWDVGGAGWQVVPLDQRVAGLVTLDDHTLAYSNGSLIVLDEPMRSIPLPEVTELVGSHGIAFYTADDTGMRIADLASGATFSIPTRRHASAPVTDGHRIVAAAVGDPPALDVITLSVPRDPAALRSWLATVTNARRTHAGIVSFP